MLVLLFQAALIFVAIPVTASTENTKFVVVLVASLIGFNSGANLWLFPSLATPVRTAFLAAFQTRIRPGWLPVRLRPPSGVTR